MPPIQQASSLFWMLEKTPWAMMMVVLGMWVSLLVGLTWKEDRECLGAKACTYVPVLVGRVRLLGGLRVTTICLVASGF